MEEDEYRFCQLAHDYISYAVNCKKLETRIDLKNMKTKAPKPSAILASGVQKLFRFLINTFMNNNFEHPDMYDAVSDLMHN